MTDWDRDLDEISVDPTVDPTVAPLGVHPMPSVALPRTVLPTATARVRRRPHPAVVPLVLVAVLAGAAVTRLDEPDAAPTGRSTPATSMSSALPAVPVSEPSAAAAPVVDPPPGSALALLATLDVKGRAPRTGYARAAFGPSWADTDRNGCDTRNDVLARDLTDEAFRSGTRDCVVISGTLADPYTGRMLTFAKADADAVQIDHVVSMSNAWQTGAFAWPAGKRLAFANDPINLLAVSGPANQAKSDGDAATWLPPNKAFRCALVARQVGVKAKYQLWVTPPERDAIARVLSAGCAAMPAPAGGNPTIAPIAAPARAVAPASPARAAAGPARAGAVPVTDYANCDAMHVDYKGGVARPGAVDRRRGGGTARYRPHYDQALYDANAESDADGDGIACEQ